MRSGGAGGKRSAAPCEACVRRALVLGFVLQTHAAGWKLFCSRRGLPPFAMWDCLPCYGWLQEALSLSEVFAFSRDRLLCWLNEIRPAGEPELTSIRLTAEGIADGNETVFQHRLRWWGVER